MAWLTLEIYFDAETSRREHAKNANFKGDIYCITTMIFYKDLLCTCSNKR